MRHVLAGATALLLGAATVPAVRAELAADPVAVACSTTSWAAGTTEWCDGTLVYRDHVYDDHGADTAYGSPHGTSLSAATGDVDHTDHGQRHNTADLVTLSLRRSAEHLVVEAELNSVFPDEPGSLLVVSVDGSRHVLGPADPATNRIHGTLELPAGTISLAAWTTLADGTPMNQAFREDESGAWFDERQGDALATDDLDAFTIELDPDDLGQRHEPAAPRLGYHDRVYTSAHPIGEGVDYSGRQVPARGSSTGGFAQDFWYLGRYQPYGVYVPPPTGDAYGVQLALHGYNAAHTSLVASDGMQAAFGDDLGRIVVVPLGRGPHGYYSDASERDVLDVLHDLRATYPIDEASIFAGGYSMGGYGALRLAALYPDTFAGVISWVGFTGDCLNGTPFAQGIQRAPDPTGTFSNRPEDRAGCPTGAVGNVYDYLDNLRHVPAALLYAAGDELVHVTGANALRDRFAQLGYEHIHWTHAAEHLTFALLDDWRKEALWTAGRRRATAPSRVTYVTNDWLGNPAYGLRHDRAYWVSEIVTADDAADPIGDSRVDLTTHACNGGSDTVASLAYGAGVDPVPWVSQEGTRELVPLTRANRITGSLVNVASLHVDGAATCVDPATVELDISADGPVTITFSDGTVRTI